MFWWNLVKKFIREPKQQKCRGDNWWVFFRQIKSAAVQVFEYNLFKWIKYKHSHRIRMYAIYGLPFTINKKPIHVSINLPYMDPSWDITHQNWQWTCEVVLILLIVHRSKSFGYADEGRGRTLPNICFAVCVPDGPMFSKGNSHDNYESCTCH